MIYNKYSYDMRDMGGHTKDLESCQRGMLRRLPIPAKLGYTSSYLLLSDDFCTAVRRTNAPGQLSPFSLIFDLTR